MGRDEARVPESRRPEPEPEPEPERSGGEDEPVVRQTGPTTDDDITVSRYDPDAALPEQDDHKLEGEPGDGGSTTQGSGVAEHLVEDASQHTADASGLAVSFDPDSLDADALVDHGFTLGEATKSAGRSSAAARMTEGEIRQQMHDAAASYGIDSSGMSDAELAATYERIEAAEMMGYEQATNLPTGSALDAAADVELGGGTVTDDGQGGFGYYAPGKEPGKDAAAATTGPGEEVDPQDVAAHTLLGLTPGTLSKDTAVGLLHAILNDPTHNLEDINAIEVTGDAIIVHWKNGKKTAYDPSDPAGTGQNGGAPPDDANSAGSDGSGSSSSDDDDDDDDDDADGGGDDEPEAEEDVGEEAPAAAGDEGEAGDEGMPSPADHHYDTEQAVTALFTNPAFAAEREVVIKGLEQQLGGGLIDVDLSSEQALEEFLASPAGREALQMMRHAVEHNGPGGTTTPTHDQLLTGVPDDHSLANALFQAYGGGAAPPPEGFGGGHPADDDGPPIGGDAPGGPPGGAALGDEDGPGGDDPGGSSGGGEDAGQLGGAFAQQPAGGPAGSVDGHLAAPGEGLGLAGAVGDVEVEDLVGDIEVVD